MRVYQHTVAPRQLYIIINNRSGGAGRLFPFIAVLRNLNDIANYKAKSKELIPCHSNHSLPGARLTAYRVVYP